MPFHQLFLQKESKRMGKIITRVLVSIVLLIFLLIGADYGQHFYLKKQIEKTLVTHENHLKVDQVRLIFSPWKSSVQLSNVKFTPPTGEITFKQLTLRQNLLDLFQVTIHGDFLKTPPYLSIEKIDGVVGYDVLGSKNKKIDIHSLELREIQTKFQVKPSSPPVELEAKLLVLKGSYEQEKKQITVSSVTPKIHVNHEDASFGLSVEGNITTSSALTGKIDLKIRNLKYLLKQMRALHLIGKTEAKIALFTLGGGGEKDQEVPLSLTISENKLWLGPIPLLDLKI